MEILLNVSLCLYIPIVIFILSYLFISLHHTLRGKRERFPTYEQSIYSLNTVIESYNSDLIKRIDGIKKIAESNTEKYLNEYNGIINDLTIKTLHNVSSEVKEILLMHFSNDGLFQLIRSKFISYLI